MLAKLGIGGHYGKGDQYFSWLHEQDFLRIIEFLIQHQYGQGVYNVTSPHPVPNVQFMNALRNALHMTLALPMPAWLLKIGAILIGTETELILKSRRVVPARLLAEGYKFKFDSIEPALTDLCTT